MKKFVQKPKKIISSKDTGLINETKSSSIGSLAASMSGSIGMVIRILQIVVVTIIMGIFDCGSLDGYDKKYIIYCDIMVMLLLGFGYLMTFVKKYGLSAVRFTMLLTALNMECNLLFENNLSRNFENPLDSIINAEFSAAALLISFGALIGRATP